MASCILDGAAIELVWENSPSFDEARKFWSIDRELRPALVETMTLGKIQPTALAYPQRTALNHFIKEIWASM